MALPFVPYIVVGILHLLALLFGADAASTLTKPLLMPALFVALLWALPRRRGEVMLLASLALLFGWLGDVSLLPAGPGILFGLGFFLLGHLAYIVLFWRRMRVRRRPRWWAAVALLWWVALVGILAPHTGALLVPLALYGLVLGGLFVVGSACGPWVTAGSTAFVVSDTLLGLHLFLPGFSPWQIDFLIMLSYLTAQGLLVAGILRRERSAAGAESPASAEVQTAGS
ncbi:lysoplasmalogenase family protein [Leifsonia poae]|uniref:lysoplasmalogenase family protein n=1 Tax=Leifsonia poae TaxID=110933 RepID=UPI001CBD1777|nr:lysoplasmalogenase family protein [Leifsonia poae]